MKLHELWVSRDHIEALLADTSTRLNLSQDERTDTELVQLMNDVGALLDQFRMNPELLSPNIRIVSQVLANIPTVPDKHSLVKAKDTLESLIGIYR